MKKIITNLFAIISFFAFVSSSFAWVGHEKDSTNMIDIGPNNLTRVGLVIEIFDLNNNQSHEAEVISMEDDGNSLELVLFDIDLQKERVFLMEND
tara:strand:+ start:16212 stop:16496 length:285 start_codon:yes stop_codon:yes gene_type:complete